MRGEREGEHRDDVKWNAFVWPGQSMDSDDGLCKEEREVTEYRRIDAQYLSGAKRLAQCRVTDKTLGCNGDSDALMSGEEASGEQNEEPLSCFGCWAVALRRCAAFLGES